VADGNDRSRRLNEEIQAGKKVLKERAEKQAKNREALKEAYPRKKN